MSGSEERVVASSEPFVPADFDVPLGLRTEHLRLEPLGPEHNERDHDAWMSSIDHIRSTPGFPDGDWPRPMTLERNLADLEMHARHFRDREGFTYTVLAGDDVVGCLYIYPMKDGSADADVRSWVRASHAELDAELRRAVARWLDERWPFERAAYAVGTDGS